MAGFFPRPMATTLRIGTDITSVARHVDTVKKLVGKLAAKGSTEQLSSSRLLALLPHKLSFWEAPLAHFHALPLLAALERRRGAWQDDVETPLNLFASWLAGRWAAKEAAIKAHFPRKLRAREVVILPSSILARLCTLDADALWPGPGGSFLANFTYDELSGTRLEKQTMLIRPVSKRVHFTPDVALQRGVFMPKTVLNQNIQRNNWRYERLPLSSYRIAQVSISHDEFAVATVLAEHHEEPLELVEDVIVDDGTSATPLHDPFLWDKDYFPWATEFTPRKPSQSNPEESAQTVLQSSATSGSRGTDTADPKYDTESTHK